MTDSCSGAIQEFLNEWERDVPKFPDCNSYMLFAVPVSFCILVGFPHTLKLFLMRSTTKRGISPLFVLEFLVLGIILVNNAAQLGFLFNYGDNETGTQLYIPMSIAVVSVTYLFILNAERLRDAPNSGVSFILTLMTAIVALVRCWNLGVDHLQCRGNTAFKSANSSYLSTPDTINVFEDKPATSLFMLVTDTTNLFGSALLLLMACFSERMIHFQMTYLRKRRKSNVCLLRNPICKPYEDTFEGSKQRLQKVEIEGSVNGTNDNEDLQVPSPENYASFLSRVFYYWFLRMIIEGYRKPLEMKDLWLLDKKHSAKQISQRFLRNVDHYLIPGITAKRSIYQVKRKMSTPISISGEANENLHQKSQIDLCRNTKFKQAAQMPRCFEPERGLSKEEHQNLNNKTDALSRFSTESIVLNSVSPLSDGVIPEKTILQMDFAMINPTNADESRDSPSFAAGERSAAAETVNDDVFSVDCHKNRDGPAKKKAFEEQQKQEVRYDEGRSAATELRTLGYNYSGAKKGTTGGHSFSPRKCTQSGLLRVLLVTFWRPLALSGFLKLIYDVLLFANPIMLKFLLKFLQDGSNEPIWHGYFYTALMLLAQCLEVLIMQRYFRLVTVLGMHIRTAITCAVYQKSLRLTNKARGESTTGQLMNLISSDAQHFVRLMPFLHVIWSGPFQIVVAVVLLWNELGPSVFAGVAVLLLLIPLSAIIARTSKSFQEMKLKVADSRIKTISEILSGIRVIKLYAWEPSFIREISRLRNQEIHCLRMFAYCQAMSFLWACSPFLVAMSTFGVYNTISNENILDPQKAFVSLTLFNVLRFPLFMFPEVASNLVQTFVSLRRLDAFLRHTELSQDSFSRESAPGIAATIECGVFAWDSDDDPVLKNISIQFPKGQLTAIVGTVGSGKSSLLHALLADMELCSGRVSISGTIAYVPQEPWIFNATLRDNVLFTRPFDPEKYEYVIRACGLGPDLAILPHGDLTEIGDKGINLSGGQKQRVSLARACYADADIYLLDDPLSAVDAHVGWHLLEHVLSRKTGLLASKTCILTTNSPKALQYSDQVAVLVDGQLSEFGTYRQLLDSNTSRLAAFLADPLVTEQSQHPAANKELHSQRNHAAMERLVQPLTTASHPVVSPTRPRGESIYERSYSIRSDVSSAASDLLDGPEAQAFYDSLVSLPEDTNQPEDKNQVEQTCNQTQLMQPEKLNTGRVKWSVFTIYLKNLGLFYCFFILILYPLAHLAQFGTSLWLADWSEDAKKETNVTFTVRSNPEILRNLSAYPELQKELDFLHRQRNYRLGVYGALGFVQLVTTLASILVFLLGHLGCAKKLHALLLNGILHAPANFFDLVPAGRIINRFSQDVATVDVALVSSMQAALRCLIQCTLTLGVACTVNPWSIVPIFCLTMFYVLILNIYVSNSRQLKRIESVTRSPIFSHFSETLNGVDCIRAYGLTEKYTQINEYRLDTNNRATYAGIISQRWLAVLLEFVGNSVVLCVALFAVSARGQFSAGLTGLIISYALSLNQSLNFFVRMMAELENNIVCVERIDEYSRIDQEPKWEIPDKKPEDQWPQGRIEFISYCTRYRPELDLVLRSISLTVNCGERIGIVGRTGSGKSSLVMALFRMLEATEGQIKIDSIDISKIGLHDLRRRLTIIPQDPVLFSGTLRFNLDPFGKHRDDQLWEALELAHMKGYVCEAGSGLGLDMTISEGGSNFSMGQRQLVCLARALLRRTRILVLDEATAAVDPITDNLIQTTIRTSFPQCTVLTIAHRLNTILDYDRVVVLHAGQIIETGSPCELLQKTGGSFYALAKDAHLVK